MFIIQIGSNIGSTWNDPIYAKILDKNNKSLLIEPNPYIFNQLKENYKDNKDNIIFENIAISIENGTQIFYFDTFERGSSQHGSLDINRLIHKQNYIKQKHNVDIKIETVEVPTMTFNSLMNKHNIKDVDLLTIDTEGYDALILMSIDFSLVNIKNLIFEHLHCGDNYGKTIQLLLDNGFKQTHKDSENVYLQRN